MIHLPNGLTTVARRPHSVRRTSTVDLRWPGEPGSELLGFGRARDLRTDVDLVVGELGAAEFQVQLDPVTREVLSLESTPQRPPLQRLVGLRSGWRSTMAEAIPDEITAGTPLYQLLDDLSGANVVAAVAVLAGLTADDWLTRFGQTRPPVGTCLGFRQGATSHQEEITVDRTGEIEAPGAILDDPYAWHDVPTWDVPFARRARRIDVWLDERALHIDSWFRDTRCLPGQAPRGIHEYRLIAEADPLTGELRKVDAVPGVLPYPECPQAVDNLDRLLGMPLAALRRNVFRELRGTLGCTHLNDAMRALTDAPVLVAHLDSVLAER